MKIQKTSLAYKSFNFGNNTQNTNQSKDKKKFITTHDKEMFVLSSCMTVFPAMDWAKRGFKDSTTIGKMGRIAGAIGIAAGLAAALTGALKVIDLIFKTDD